MISIRKVMQGDRDTYLDLVNEFYDSPAVLHKIDVRNFESAFDEIIKSDLYAEGFFIEEEGSVIGYILVSKTYSQEAGGMVLLIEEIYLREGHRGKGISKIVFDFLYTRYEGYKRFRLEVEKSNIGALKLYKKIGYEELSYIQFILENKENLN